MKRLIIIAAAIIVGACVSLLAGKFLLLTNLGVGLTEWCSNYWQGDPAIPPSCEWVMPPETTIEAATASGTIIVRSGKGLKRYYTWDGATRYVVMIPRHERWYGSLGMYYPGPGTHWLPSHHGISRGVLEEGQQSFKSITDAMGWIRKQQGWYSVVYRDDGLLVAFGKHPAREQLNVGVWQVRIGGHKPNRLAGSKNLAIKSSWKP